MDPDFVAVGLEVGCPNCRATFPADVTLVADAQRRPGLRQRAAAGSLNLVACPHCGTSFVVPAPVLYVDPAAQRAIAYVPADAGDDHDEIVTALLSRYIAATPSAELPDYLLEPEVHETALAFALATAGGAVLEEERPAGLDATLAWLDDRGDTLLAQVVEALTSVHSAEAWIHLLNERPGYVRPEVAQALVAAGEEAEQEGRDAVAEVLFDLVAALHAHTPQGLKEEDEEDEQMPDEVRDMMIAGDIEAGAAYLDEPSERRAEDAQRATLGVQIEEALQREGFIDHARLFGTLVEDAMQDAVPLGDDDDAAEPAELVMPEDLPAEAFAELLVADGVDGAMAVLDQFPELQTPMVARVLQQMAAGAADEGDEGRAAHLDGLRSAVQMVIDENADDEDEDEAEA